MAIDAHNHEYIQECINKIGRDPEVGNAVLGFDGYIDNIRYIVAERESASEYREMQSLTEFSEQLDQTIEIKNSISFEWYCTEQRMGGHTGNVGRAYRALGVDASIIGPFGKQKDSLYKEKFDNHNVLSVGTPAITEAIQFNDGKLMIVDVNSMEKLDWDMILDQIPLNELADIFDGTEIFSMGIWSTMPNISTIWEGTKESLWPLLNDPPERILIEPGDIRRLPPKRINDDLDYLLSLDSIADLTISGNRSEINHLAKSVMGSTAGTFTQTVQNLHKRLKIAEVIGHSQDRSILVNDEATYTFDPEPVKNPEITTAAGDNFNAGYLFARLLGCSNAASLVLSNVTANRFISNGKTPNTDILLTYLEECRERC